MFRRSEQRKRAGLVAASISMSLALLLGVGAQDLDLRQHSVPLDEVFLDTFIPGRPPVPLSKADRKLINRIRDAIPPLRHPKYIPSGQAAFLQDDDWIVGIEIEGDARAYPVRILNYHEIVNDTVGGHPILVSYCPLCRSGIVYRRRVGRRLLSFGNTGALYQSDMLMVDQQTSSWWYQVAGEAIIGSLTGTRLTPLPSVMATWKQWRKHHQRSLVLSPETGHEIKYGRDGYGEPYRFGLNSRRKAPFPTARRVFRDSRLMPAERILGLDIDGTTRAYRLGRRGTRVINDTLGEAAVVIFIRAGVGLAYNRRHNRQLLEFKISSGKIIDKQTGSRWTLGGRAVAGPLADSQLEALPTRSTYWFAWIAAFPETDLLR